MATFFAILPEIQSGIILPLLSQNDLLRLRRVCKQTKVSSEDYISLKGLPKPPVFEIHNGPSENSNPSARKYTLAEYIEAEPFPYPSRRFIFDLTHQNNPSMPPFDIPFKATITQVRMKGVFPEMPFDCQFLMSLPNLTHLSIDQVNATRSDIFTTPMIRDEVPFLKLTHLTVERDTAKNIEEAYMIWQLFSHCPKLESVNYPVYPNLDLSVDNPDSVFVNVVKTRMEEVEKGRFSPLKTIDLRNFQTKFNQAFMKNFICLCDLAFKNGIRLDNVNPALLWVIRTFYDKVGKPPIAYCIRSLSGCIQGDMFYKCPVYLRKLEIGRNTSMVSWTCLKVAVPTENAEWPRLAEVDCLVDTVLSRQNYAGLFKILFDEGYNREKLTELKLEFKQTPEEPIVPNIHIPKVENITKNCYNIKCLTLIGWPGENKQLLQLWQGLLHLENVTLENIPTLGNVAFVGDDVDDPIFLKLKMLRCLRLRGLNKMPKVTDTAFHLVIQHLPLTELEMEASEPLSTVTTRGIRELLKGKFADTIERFSFENWALKGVSVDDFKALEREFRSTQMI